MNTCSTDFYLVIIVISITLTQSFVVGWVQADCILSESSSSGPDDHVHCGRGVGESIDSVALGHGVG
jgi:hypothetical protein